MSIIPNKRIQDLIIDIRFEKVILDSDVANIYGVKTKEVNQDISNNKVKFPPGSVLTSQPVSHHPSLVTHHSSVPRTLSITMTTHS